MKARLYFLFVSLAIIWNVQAQRPDKNQILEQLTRETLDSVKGSLYYDLTRSVLSQDSVLARAYADSALMYYKKAGHEMGMNQYQYIRGVIEYSAGRYENAILWARRYHEWTVQERHIEREWYAVSSLAMAYRESGAYESGIEACLRGIEIGIQLKRDNENGFFYNELGNLFATLKQWAKSTQYFQKAYALSIQTNYPAGQSVSLRNIISNWIQQKDFRTADSILQICFSLDSVIGSGIFKSRNYQLKAKLAELRNEPDQAIDAYRLAWKLMEKESNPTDRVTVLLGLAKNYLLTDQPEQAISYYDQAVQEPSQQLSAETLAERYKLDAQILARRGAYPQAYQALESYIDYQTNRLNTDITQQITGLQISHETARKEDQIQLLTIASTLAQTKLRTTRIIMIILLVGLVLVSFLGYSLYHTSLLTKRQKALIEKSLREKDILIKEIHHRVKNNLQFISSLLNLQARYVTDPGTVSVLKEGQNRVKSMALIHQNLYQEKNLTGIEVKKYLEVLIQNLFHSYNTSRDRIRLEMNIQELNLDVDTMIPLGLIINELVSNALKYAFPDQRAGCIRIQLQEGTEGLILEVSDDGVGLPGNAQPSTDQSFGFRMIRAFAQQLQAKLIIDSDQGTNISLHIQDYKKAA
jgi:two-component system, sensor histidine kinase PdtaS